MKKTSAFALDISDPVKTINPICNINQSILGTDYLWEMIVCAAKFLCLTFVEIGQPDLNNIDYIRPDVFWAAGEL
jgi:hypothetical protein